MEMPCRIEILPLHGFGLRIRDLAHAQPGSGLYESEWVDITQEIYGDGDPEFG